MEQNFILIFLLGSTAGVVGSLLGLGGGIILVPSLLMFTDLSQQLIVSASLFTVIASSIATTEVKFPHKLIDYKTATPLEFYGMCGGVIGALMAGYVSKKAMMLILGGVMVLVAVKTFIQQIKNRKKENLSENSNLNATPISGGKRVLLNSVCLFSGSLSGMLGIGGGIINVPALTELAKLPIKTATATSAYMMGITGSLSALVYLLRGDVDPLISSLAILGVIPGAKLGHWISLKLPPSVLRVIFAILLFSFGVKLCLN